MSTINNDLHEYNMGRMSFQQLPIYLQRIIQNSNENQNSNIIYSVNNNEEEIRIEYENSMRLLNMDLPPNPPRLTRQPNYYRQ